MKISKIISFVVSLTLVTALLTMPAYAALIVNNGEIATTSSTTKADFDENFGNVVECNKFGAAGIYNMYFTGNDYNGAGGKGPYRMMVSTSFNSRNHSALSSKSYTIRGYIALDSANYTNANSNSNTPGIHMGLAKKSDYTWAGARTNMKLQAFVEHDYIQTDRLTKFDYVVSPSYVKDETTGEYVTDETTGERIVDSSKVHVDLYFNNKKNSGFDVSTNEATSYTMFAISLQNPYESNPGAINIYAGKVGGGIAEAGVYVPNGGTGSFTAEDTILENYAPNFVSGENFYVPAGTTVSDILSMTSTYNTFKVFAEDGTEITTESETAILEGSAAGYYIYTVGEGNNTSKSYGLYSKIYNEQTGSLETSEDAEGNRIFTARYLKSDGNGQLLVAKYDGVSKQLTKVLNIAKVNGSTHYKKNYTVSKDDYDENSIYKAFLWDKSNLAPVVQSVEF